MVQQKQIRLGTRMLQVHSLPSLSVLRIWHCHGLIGHRHSPDLALMWLWYRPAATALIRPLAWEPLYAVGATLKR